MHRHGRVRAPWPVLVRRTAAAAGNCVARTDRAGTTVRPKPVAGLGERIRTPTAGQPPGARHHSVTAWEVLLKATALCGSSSALLLRDRQTVVS
jgi:hypothetical protein